MHCFIKVLELSESGKILFVGGKGTEKHHDCPVEAVTHGLPGVDRPIKAVPCGFPPPTGNSISADELERRRRYTASASSEKPAQLIKAMLEANVESTQALKSIEKRLSTNNTTWPLKDAGFPYFHRVDCEPLEFEHQLSQHTDSYPPPDNSLPSCVATIHA